MTKPVIDPATLTEEQREITNDTCNPILAEMLSTAKKLLKLKEKGENNE